MSLSPRFTHKENSPHATEAGTCLRPVGKKKPRRVTWGRAAGLLLLAVVLALAFMGHLTPAMRVQWANFVSLCGF